MKFRTSFSVGAVLSTVLLASSSASAATTVRLHGTQPAAVNPYYALNYIYVANTPTDSITVYRSDERGDERPYMKIEGPKTRLDGPIGLAFDTAGQLYVVNRGNASSVTVYAAHAYGNVAPIRVLKGPKTLLRNNVYPAEPPDYPWGSIAVDLAHDRLFIGNISTANPAPYNGRVLIFRANASGDERPIGSIGNPNTYHDQDLYGFDIPAMLSFEHHGAELLVGDNQNYCCNGGGGWAYYRTSDLSYLGDLSMYATPTDYGAAVKPLDGDLVDIYGQIWKGHVTGESFPAPGYPEPISALVNPYNTTFSAIVSDSSDTVWALSGSTVLEGFEAGHHTPRLITGLVGATALATIEVDPKQ